MTREDLNNSIFSVRLIEQLLGSSLSHHGIEAFHAAEHSLQYIEKSAS